MNTDFSTYMCQTGDWIAWCGWNGGEIKVGKVIGHTRAGNEIVNHYNHITRTFYGERVVRTSNIVKIEAYKDAPQI